MFFRRLMWAFLQCKVNNVYLKSMFTVYLSLVWSNKNNHSEMKPKHLDRISSLPENIIETILCLVPIKDAVRTSILARNWRYRWTKITKLVFIEKDMFKKATKRPRPPPELVFEEPLNERKKLTRKCKLFYAVQQVLLLHDAPIFEFTLCMDDADKTCVEIDQIITHLSRHKTLNKFNLFLPFCPVDDYDTMYKLPISIFSLHQLTHLSLHGCKFEFEPTFTGLGNLTTLSLTVTTFKNTLLHLLSGCPLLKSFTLSCDDEIQDRNLVTIIDLFKCLPIIEHLTISGSSIECFIQNRLPRQLSTPLVHLKYLCIEELKLTVEFQLLFLGLLFRSAPNLEKIKLDEIGEYSLYENQVRLELVSDIWLEHLIELEIKNFAQYEHEFEFVKLILVKSPMLKKVKIFFRCWITKDEELQMLRTLLRSPRASPLAEIIVEHDS